MWTWLLLAYLATLVTIIACAGPVALFATNHRRATRAHHILNVAIGALSGTVGVLAAVLRLP
ncbi:hypothetical protein [Actinokineospora iranica]|uniref:Uncharacterized protein n=1 Tax=Actinokineospora iranica TaxID=1271860 RepID=A0A1G6M8F5_9PSEU|nr:hypothetical protein [Actinokineospora iranica]SDC51627.1 hypothetical protein SAMN05216174_102417 [Actinokineospora iranica]